MSAEKITACFKAAAASAAVFAASLSPLAAAAADVGQWMVEDQVSALDGAVSYKARLISSSTVADIISQPDNPILSFSCDAKGLFATIIWPDFIDRGSDSYMATVVWKLDDGPVQKSRWIASSQGTGPTGRAAQAWIQQLAVAKKLIVRVPDDHGGQEAVFDLDGIAEIGPKVAAMSCG